MESPDDKKSKWWRFKRWCYIYHQELALGMMIILIIIGIWYNPFEEIGVEQDGGGNISAYLKGVGSAAKYSGYGIAPKGTDASNIAKEGPDIKLNEMGSKYQRFQQKSAAIMSSGSSMISKGAGKASSYVMDKFRDNASLIYEVFYQIAFIVIILLIVFPTIGFFIIAII